jgi:hypothetical protein
MLRSTASRALRPRSLSSKPIPGSRSSYSAASPIFRASILVVRPESTRPRAPQPLQKCRTSPSTSTTTLFYSTKSRPSFDKPDVNAEKKLAGKKLKPHPEAVSSDSTVRHVFEGEQRKEESNEMLSGIKSDIATVKETFSLSNVPRESLYIGAAGVLPYAATSLSTVYLAFDINHARDNGAGYFFSPETAHQLLDMVTPIQVGYGAVVSPISSNPSTLIGPNAY